jgi:hypothetical protein
VIEDGVAVGRAQERFDADGVLTDDELLEQLGHVVGTLIYEAAPVLVAA